MVSQMVKIGEETGELDKMLGKIADFYEDEVDASIQSLTSIIEPILMIGVGVMVGTIVISMYLPMFKLLTLDQVAVDDSVDPAPAAFARRRSRASLRSPCSRRWCGSAPRCTCARRSSTPTSTSTQRSPARSPTATSRRFAAGMSPSGKPPPTSRRR